MTTPAWQSAENGLPVNQNAVNASAQINQFLGTHAFSALYSGSRIITPVGGTGYSQSSPGNGVDFSQPIVMPGGKTAIGRISIPMTPSGNGADMLISLCPDLAGAPDTANPITATLVPANWSRNFAAPNGLPTGGPLALPQFNNLSGSTNITVVPWASPTVDSTGTPLNSSSITSSGNFFILAGGNTVNPTGAVATGQFTGAGTLATMVSQPSIPQPSFFAMLAATTGSLVYAGGNTNPTLTANVYTASWDVNTGTVGTWSLQTALPVAIQHGGAAASGNTVYIVGGVDGSSVLQKAVYYSSVSNGQITTWSRGPDLPVAIQQMSVAVVGGWLIVSGGAVDAPSATPTGQVLFSKIMSDGSLGPWQTGPSLPVPMFIFSSGWGTAVTDSAVILVGGQTGAASFTNNMQSLTVTANGPGDYWKQVTWSSPANFMAAAFPVGNGRWDVFTPQVGSNQYLFSIMTPTPLISVPLAATGLTPGNTYHVVIQQNQNANSSDFMSLGFNNGGLPNDTLRSNRHSGTWTTFSAGRSIPLVVYDNSVGGNVLHTWEDSSNLGSSATINMASRISTQMYDSMSNLLARADSALMPNNPLDLNPTFTTGTANWTATNCTLTQSSAQVHGGFPFSGLMTPNGTSATVFVESNKSPVPFNPSTSNAQFWVRASGWVYSPTGFANVSLSVKWYDRSNNLLSTSSNVVSVPAATWTFLNNFFLVPVGASQATLVPTESGTPAAGNTLFLSNVTLIVSQESTGYLSSVTEVSYSTDDPNSPISVIDLS